LKIGIILHPYGEVKPAGLARTIFEFTNGFLTIDTANEYVIFLKNAPQKMPEFPGKNWRVEVLGGGMFWLENLRKFKDIDVCIFNTPVVPIWYKPKRTIVIALDFAYYYLSGKRVKTWILRAITFLYHKFSLWRADRIIAISQATKDDVVKLFGVPSQKITVVHCGFKKICDVPEMPVILPQKFFLFVGIIKERKNVFNIVKAFELFQKNISGYHLVIGGNPTGTYFDMVKQYVAEHDLSKKVLFIGHLNDGQLSHIYRRAEALVFPTLIEGFGFPVLEAMHCGTPVITSNQSSLREVGGNNSALLVDPYTPEDIAGAMANVVQNQNERKNLVENGYKQIERFSWNKAAEEFLRIINL